MERGSDITHRSHETSSMGDNRVSEDGLVVRSIMDVLTSQVVRNVNKTEAAHYKLVFDTDVSPVAGCLDSFPRTHEDVTGSSTADVLPFNSTGDEDFRDLTISSERPCSYNQEKKRTARRKEKQAKRRRQSSHKNEDSKERNTPTHFVALEIDNEDVRRKLRNAQDRILERDERLQVAKVAVEKAHVTMLVIKIHSDDDLMRAKQALDQVTTHIHTNKVLDGQPLEVCGIGHFNNKTVFAKVSPDALRKVGELLTETFASHGLVLTDPRPLKPHITLMKLSKNPVQCRKLGLKRIASDLFTEFAETSFGQQAIHRLQLCDMLPSPGLYYNVLHSAQVSPSSPSCTQHSGISLLDDDSPSSCIT